MRFMHFALAVIMIVSVILAGCSAAPGFQSPGRETDSSAPSSGAFPPAPARQPAAAPAPAAPGSTGSAVPPADAEVFHLDRKIIYTTHMLLTVRSVTEAITGATDVAQRFGGHVLSLNSRYDGEHQLATMTIRVNSNDFAAAIEQLRRLAVKVESESTTTQDVTEEFIDLESRLRTLQAAEAQYLELLRRAQNIEDILRVQQRLTEVQVQIEQIKGRLNFLQRRTDLATITLEIRPEALARGSAPRGDLIQVVVRAWEASMVFLRNLAEVAITFVVFFWWLLPFVGLGIWLYLSRRRRPPAEAPSGTP